MLNVHRTMVEPIEIPKEERDQMIADVKGKSVSDLTFMNVATGKEERLGEFTGFVVIYPGPSFPAPGLEPPAGWGSIKDAGGCGNQTVEMLNLATSNLDSQFVTLSSKSKDVQTLVAQKKEWNFAEHKNVTRYSDAKCASGKSFGLPVFTAQDGDEYLYPCILACKKGEVVAALPGRDLQGAINAAKHLLAEEQASSHKRVRTAV